MAIGYDDPMPLHQALTNDEMSIARMALGNNKSAAEIIYNLAQQRGYRRADRQGQRRRTSSTPSRAARTPTRASPTPAARAATPT